MQNNFKVKNRVENSFYSDDELSQLGLKVYGTNVKISRKSSLYSPETISIGNNVRIDDFSILSGYITIGNYVHINAYNGLFASTAGIILEDFVNLSSRITIYAISDDYSGESMTSPLVADEFKNIFLSPVLIKRHSIIGTGTTILPSVTIDEGCSIGAMSLVKKSTKPWGIYAGAPVRYIKERKKDLLELEKLFMNQVI